MKIQNVFEDVIIGMGITVSLLDLQQILSIILLCIDVLLILWKIGVRIYNDIKNKKFDNIEKDLKDGRDELEQITHKEDSGKGE